MEPRVQYCSTDDGVSIAFWDEGEGHPLVIMPALPFSHLQLEWQIPEWHAYYERLIENYRVIRYDPRGTGLSDRATVAESIHSHLADLEAVVEHLGLGRFALLAIAHAGPVAIEYAAAFPQRVSHLAFWCSYPSATPPPPEYDWELPLMRQNFALYSQTMALSVAGFDRPAAARSLAQLFREANSLQSAMAVRAVFGEIDTRPWLSSIQAPTLVMTRRSVTLIGTEAGPGIARRIPGAHLAMFEGDAIAPFLGDAEPFFAALENFLPQPASTPSEVEIGGLRIILFTDLEGHTTMMNRLGDLAGRQVLREHERLTRSALRAFGGSEVKTFGDGFLASFGSAQKALDCAVALQQQVAKSTTLQPQGLTVRIGINAGEPIAEDDDLFGNAVIAASRIAGLARGGEILVANVVRELAAGKGFLFNDRGDHTLRGFEDPVHLWEVRWQE